MRKSWSKGYKWVIDSLDQETNECIIYPYGLNNGYPRLYFRIAEREYSRIYGNRLVCEKVYGKAPTEKHEAAHGCGNRACVNKRHLRWALPSENQSDRVYHNTSNRGEKQGGSKLKEHEVFQILNGLHIGEKKVHLAKFYGVSTQTIDGIAAGRCWDWLTNITGSYTERENAI